MFIDSDLLFGQVLRHDDTTLVLILLKVYIYKLFLLCSVTRSPSLTTSQLMKKQQQQPLRHTAVSNYFMQLQLQLEQLFFLFLFVSQQLLPTLSLSHTALLFLQTNQIHHLSKPFQCNELRVTHLASISLFCSSIPAISLRTATLKTTFITEKSDLLNFTFIYPHWVLFVTSILVYYGHS